MPPPHTHEEKRSWRLLLRTQYPYVLQFSINWKFQTSVSPLAVLGAGLVKCELMLCHQLGDRSEPDSWTRTPKGHLVILPPVPESLTGPPTEGPSPSLYLHTPYVGILTISPGS